MGPAHRVIDWVTQHFQESEKSNVMFARYFYTASHLFQDGLKKAKKKKKNNPALLLLLYYWILITTSFNLLLHQYKMNKTTLFSFICQIHAAILAY